MRPEHIELLQLPSSPTVHPDGSWAVVAVSRPSLDADCYVGQLWRLDLAGDAAPRRLTRGVHDSGPQFSPDGRLLAFTRGDADGKPQVHVVRTDGGEPFVITAAKLGVGAFRWSPDSARIAFTARVAEDGRYGSTEGVAAGAEDPRHITTNKFQANGLGWTNDRRPRLFVVAVPDSDAEPPVKPVGRAAKHTDTAEPFSPAPQATELTDGTYDVHGPVFTPDGDAIVFAAARAGDADLTLRTELYRVPVEGGEAEPVAADGRWSYDQPAFSTDGQWLFFMGADLGDTGTDFVATNEALFVAPAAGGAPRRLTDPTALELVSSPEPSGADAVLVLHSTRGSADLLRVTAHGVVTTVHAGLPTILEAVAVPGSEAVLAVVTGTDSPGEVAVVDRDGVRLLTDFAARLRAETRIAQPIELISTSPDGHEVHGWALLPEGDGPHPVLLSIHGGPYASYPATFFDEFQVYTEAGYAVVACNPRGSGGYGPDHGAAIRHDFGNLDTIDVLGFLDHATATVPGLDAARVGVMGGSYGGYLTAWIIAHDHRWAGAIVERGFLDPASFLGSSDIGWFFMPEYNGTDRADQDRQSPTLLAHQVTTPTFVMHSELDLRCPLAQALRYYAELKQAGVETELLVFPGENHELSRSGTPWHRVRRFEKILDWWQRHLPVGASDPAE